ncbi:Na(+)-translocating NADH-quinone reductase subunit E [Erwinia sp. OLTSP20]|uniref:multidrug/biocide efflux PACE transporter n=1 Tax=unclassified Erwinia TaxID=2622719 RepID=UPI000C17E67A|nr:MULTISPECIES: multidrug/biocide efflux PACE transporter [unclassified Erwinia]PIJ50627.1 Na(+)-translocating NADH-quinone reductase subunit E [Erwinia sp. OAMSP11]PIJ72673.1 Na(+)-translocating NADH-quinone reductase subunit E [Erwinia sp. OLSSP12]PIJ83244.1 Na(+)-translocating NADH-quinone reductase subunit E [Erwinia sp. OLCASP19]PIJ85254.1 Na(+)-translocating NADH-quinone reductase subunit E [Erwinia sp. OLMTSP26]PIJ87256.1 Na(+)-translocating NADH-quinone reductase subunit E [Erwinia sp
MHTRSLKERIIHAVIFEILAIATVSPLSAWVMNRPWLTMGTLAIILSTLAMIWNMVYNAGFDRLYPPGQPRSPQLRILHALGFEGGFILIGLPVVALMLKITLIQAFMLDIAFFLFFLPFTMLYNWLYDRVLNRLMARRQCCSQ